MGIAAYNRGSLDLARQIDASCAERRNTLQAKASLWAQCAEAGHVMSWRMADGRVITYGPYQTADGKRAYAVLEHGGARREHITGMAWHAALWLVARVGRVRPD